jgi:hypothetical protein
MRRRTTIVAVLSLLVMTAGMFVFVQEALLTRNPTRYDFYPLLTGTRAFWQGESPYSDEVMSRIQIGMFGERLQSGEDLQRFAHPAYTAVMIAPFALFDDNLALALWLTLQLIAWVVTPFVWLHILRWRLYPLAVVMLVLAVVFGFRYPMVAFSIGQFTGSMVLLLSLAVLALRDKHDLWAGAALALATMPPTITGPVGLLIMVAYALCGRPRGLLGFIATLGIANIMVLARIGWWIPVYLDVLRGYAEYARPDWALQPFAAVVQILLIGSFLGIIVWALLRMRRSMTWENQLDFMALVLAFSLIMLPQTGSYYLALLIPLVMISLWRARTLGQRRWMVWLAAGLFLASPWLHVASGFALNEALISPALAILLYIWAAWWRSSVTLA